MRKPCSTRIRTRGKQVLTASNRMVPFFACVQISSAWREWRFHLVSLREAQLRVHDLEAVAVTRMRDGVVQVVGYRATKPTRAERPSPATLTFQTMVAVGRHALGCSLSWRERQEVAKFRVWPLIGDLRNPATVRPRISAEDRRVAEKLLGGGQVAHCAA